MKRLLILAVLALNACSAQQQTDAEYIASHFHKLEVMVPMRDGVQLFTSIYIPNDTLQRYPVLFMRTPYSVAPYGPGKYRGDLGPSPATIREGYIFVYQDVRGCFMSEGEFVDVRPYFPVKKSKTDIDESSDAYDSIEWLLKHIGCTNGRVGMYGSSYPGFYAAMGVIDAHPALKAASPQAPIADWFIGDDFHHNGALFLPHSFAFTSIFGRPRPQRTTEWGQGFQFPTPDGYDFFLSLGPLKHINDRYLKGNIKFWNQMLEHTTYDRFWQERCTLPHFKNIKPAVMVVGGWFDAEDLYGALRTFGSINEKNPDGNAFLLMGPWFHGGWFRSDGTHLGAIQFGPPTAPMYLDTLIPAFFRYYLKDEGTPPPSKATVFCTGENRWHRLPAWPPAQTTQTPLYCIGDGSLSFSAPASSTPRANEYVSDPAKPVPFSEEVSTGMTREYMTDDQRFASRRPDVLAYQTPPLDSDITVAGTLTAELFVSTTGTDADYIVKFIDVLPDATTDPIPNPSGKKLGGYQMLVRGEPFRARFRNSYSTPEPMQPGAITAISFKLPDIFHTFKRGHRIMVQIQSSWFPLVDRNPQTYVDIPNANERDFQTAKQTIYCEPKAATRVILPVLK